MEDIRRWLVDAPTPVLWISGPPGSGAAAALDAAIVQTQLRSLVVRPDTLDSTDEPFTTKRLLEIASSDRLLVVHDLDTRQEPAGPRANEVTDCRLRQLFAVVCRRSRRSRIAVTSRLPPPASLPAASLTTVAVHGAGEERAPELEGPAHRLARLVSRGSTRDAIDVYWNELGNFSQLHRDGRDHLGAHLCRVLNEGFPPDALTDRLRACDVAWFVVNDWSQFAVSIGDADTAVRAAVAACELAPRDRPPWDHALLAAHAGQACLAAGDLRAAMRWSERSWQHAREGTRVHQGVAVREVMNAYDLAAKIMARVYERGDQPAERSRLIDDLTAIHERARESVAEFDASAVLPVAALTEPGSSDDAAVASQRERAERRDDSDDECELAARNLPLVEDAAARLPEVEAYLARAEACGLGLHWRDLQLLRARTLEELGRREDARVAATATLLGAGSIRGAHETADWAVARKALELLDRLGAAVAANVRADVDQAAPPPRRSPEKPHTRRPPPSRADGATARAEMHDAAMAVLERYAHEGAPFAVYFRTFSVEVLHGPFELGPKLIENALRDALPPEVEVVTIQDPGGFSAYDRGASRMRREAPALLLEDERWAKVAAALIAAADLIVSEPLMLSGGVRLELQMIYDAQRWDRTVLLLPPLDAPLATIDNDPIVQMFPRGVWADSLHQERFTDSPVIADLLARIRVIAGLPADVRRTLVDPSARDASYPINLAPVAAYFDREAELGPAFNPDDKRTRYYAFWQSFRACSIHGHRFLAGDTSAETRCRLARCYLRMSVVMLDHTVEGERVVLEGDPAEAKRLVQSAYALLQPLEEDLWVRALRSEAERRWEDLGRLERAIGQNAQRFEIRPRYGPLVMQAKSERT